MKTRFFFGLSLFLAVCLVACNSEDKSVQKVPEDEIVLVTESVNYSQDTVNMKGYAAFDKNQENAPVIIIIPEWWGLNEYAKNRAEQLSKLGYFAFAVDMYGNGKIANDPSEAGTCAGPFYADPSMANSRIMAALNKLKDYPQADLENVVAIGYCFGGSMVLNAAKSGLPFKGVVSFHGGLAGLPVDKSKLKAKILVCHGAADQFVSSEEVANFKKELDDAKVNYTFKSYANATHAFSNPDATANGKKFKLPIAYNKKADEASWKDFMEFLKNI